MSRPVEGLLYLTVTFYYFVPTFALVYIIEISTLQTVEYTDVKKTFFNTCKSKVIYVTDCSTTVW
jgi:hypothetical protein